MKPLLSLSKFSLTHPHCSQNTAIHHLLIFSSYISTSSCSHNTAVTTLTHLLISHINVSFSDITLNLTITSVILSFFVSLPSLTSNNPPPIPLKIYLRLKSPLIFFLLSRYIYVPLYSFRFSSSFSPYTICTFLSFRGSCKYP